MGKVAYYDDDGYDEPVDSDEDSYQPEPTDESYEPQFTESEEESDHAVPSHSSEASREVSTGTNPFAHLVVSRTTTPSTSRLVSPAVSRPISRASTPPALSRVTSPPPEVARFIPPEKRPIQQEWRNPPAHSHETLEEALRQQFRSLTVMTAGHVDSGKSTLLGSLMVETGTVAGRQVQKLEAEAARHGKASFGRAWLLDEDECERDAGITFDVAHSSLVTAAGTHVTLLDCPGHADLVPNLLQAGCSPDCALLLVDASPDAFEKGFGNGQTREHLQLLRAMLVSDVIIVINKMDRAGWAEERFAGICQALVPFARQCGFAVDRLRFVPAAALTGAGIASAPPVDWYRGPTVVEALEALVRPPDASALDVPLRFVVTEMATDYSDIVLYGCAASGAVVPGDRVLMQPTMTCFTVRSVLCAGESVGIAAGSGEFRLNLRVTGAMPPALPLGAVLVTGSSLVTESRRIVARLSVLEPRLPIMTGTDFDAFLGTNRVDATLKGIVSVQNAAQGTLNHPRFIPRRSAAVVRLQLDTWLPVVPYSAPGGSQLGRIVLRSGSETVAVGVVLEVITES